MEIKDRILELLNLAVFGKSNPKHSIFDSYKDDEYGLYDCRIGIKSIDNHNYVLFGNAKGRIVKSGKKEYNDELELYCRDWADCFISTIKISLFDTIGGRKYKNIYNYLKHLDKKVQSAEKINKEIEEHWDFIYDVCCTSFGVQGDIGEENIRVNEVIQNSPVYLLDNLSWSETEPIILTDEDDLVMEDVEDFLDRIMAEEDIIRVAKLFTDVGIMCRKEIDKHEDDSYTVTFPSWNIWRNNEIEWIEKIGEVIPDQSSFLLSEHLEINGTYEEIETMINLIKGDR